MTDRIQQLKPLVEAALLATDIPLTIDKLVSLFPDDARPTREEVRQALIELQADYEHHGVELRQIDTGYRFQTREEFAPLLQKLWEGRPPRYSRALLETLAIIAYRQPVTRGEIEEIRGVSVSSEMIKTLLNREWIRLVGHRDVPGKPALFGTTRGFLEHFNLKGLSELPPLSELRDIETIAGALNMRLDLEGGGDAQAGAETPPRPASEAAEGTVDEEVAVVRGAESAGISHD